METELNRNLKLIEANNLLSKLDTAELEGELEEITQNAAEKNKEVEIGKKSRDNA